MCCQKSICKCHDVYHLAFLGLNVNWLLRFLVNDQCDAQIPFYVFILFITLYMFPAHHAHHQERQIVSIQPLVTVTLCEWPCLVQVGSRLVW